MKKPPAEKAAKKAPASRAQKPLTNRAKQRIDTRNQVYEAAIDEFKRAGIANTQIEAIVSRAGVSVGTFYRYFSGRDDVLRELQRRNAALVIERTGRIRKSQDLSGYLKQLLKMLLIDAPPSGVTLERDAMLSLVKNPPEPDSIEVHPIYGTVIMYLRDGQEAGTIRTDISAPVLGKLFFFSVFGVLAGTLRENRHQTDADAMLEVYLSGIQAERRPQQAKSK